MPTTSTPKRFLMIGDTIMDFVTLGHNTDQTNYTPLGGGAIANVARHLSTARHHVELITAFAPDPFGDLLRKELTQLDVKLNYAQTIAHSESPLCFISNADDGERYFLHRGGDPYAALSVRPDDIDLDAYDFFVWGISSVRTPESRFLIDRIMEQSNATVVCDPGTCPTWWGAPDALKAHLLERLHKIDILKCSQPEAEWLSGFADPSHAVQWLSNRGPRLAVVTDGKNGLYANFGDGHETFHIPARSVVSIDTTGAGDATLAGFLNYLANDGSAALPKVARPALESGSDWGAKTVGFRARDHGTYKQMTTKSKRIEGFRTTLSLALPLGLASAGEQLLGFVDTVIAGHLGPTQLAATGLGNAIFMAALILSVGTLSGFETMTAQARGRGETNFVGRVLNSRRFIALALTIPTIILCEVFVSLYFHIGDLDPGLKHNMSDYLSARYLCVPFVLHATISRSLLQAFEDPKAVFRSMVYINILNIPLNLMLATSMTFTLGSVSCHGLGLGVVGLGLSTSVLACVRAVYLKHQFKRHVAISIDKMSRSDLMKLLRIGLPIGLHWLSEMGMFSIVGLMAGHLGVHQAAAHQIAMTLSSLSFTLCLGLSVAGTVRVGLAVGENDADLARREGNRSLLLGLILMGTSALCFFAFSDQLGQLFSINTEVLTLSAVLIQIAATFQIVDGVQAVMAGNLRGLGATRWAFASAVLGFWCIGFPAAYIMSQSIGTAGLWWGLVVGLSFSAVLQALGFYRSLKPKRFARLATLLD